MCLSPSLTCASGLSYPFFIENDYHPSFCLRSSGWLHPRPSSIYLELVNELSSIDVLYFTWCCRPSSLGGYLAWTNFPLVKGDTRLLLTLSKRGAYRLFLDWARDNIEWPSQKLLYRSLRNTYLLDAFSYRYTIIFIELSKKNRYPRQKIEAPWRSIDTYGLQCITFPAFLGNS